MLNTSASHSRSRSCFRKPSEPERTVSPLQAFGKFLDELGNGRYMGVSSDSSYSLPRLHSFQFWHDLD